MDRPPSPPNPPSSARPNVGPRPLPIPPAFRHLVPESGTPDTTSRADTASPRLVIRNPTHNPKPNDLRTFNSQRATIQDLRAKVVRSHTEKKLTASRLRQLERENQQLHQDALWTESHLESLKERLEAGNGFAERNGMVEIISKTLAVELLLAKKRARELGARRDGDVGK